MAALAKSTLFPQTITTEMFSKVSGHSSIAKLSAQKPIPFNGTDVFVFDFSSNVSIVGEGAAKPAGDAAISAVQIRPIKIIYQSRVSDEFVRASNEVKLNYMRTYTDGMAKMMAEALDLMVMHGVNPATGSSSDIIGNNHFDYAIPSGNKIVFGHDSSTIDANIEEALGKVSGGGYPVTGVILSPEARTSMANVTQNTGERKYPDFAFGGAPAKLGAATLDVNPTVSANSNKDRVILGDFAGAFRWGYAAQIPLEVIQYGNPDGGTYDLKQCNQVLLRSEAYLGWGILNPASFAKVYVNP